MGETVRIPRPARTSVDAAIENGSVYAVMQPIVELATGSVLGYEALARCKVEALASPLDLFAAAVEQGSLFRLGRELRRQSVIAAKGQQLFLNVHPLELDSQELVSASDPIAELANVVLEVPESSPLDRYRYSIANIDALRTRGVRIALDDFGAGYSNFAYINQLAPTYVKLDRALIAGVWPFTRQHRLLCSLSSLCTSQGVQLIAEGVETHEELMAVMSAGIPFAQGYFLGRPSLTGATTWAPS